MFGFTELNVNSDTVIKNVKHVELNIKCCDCFLENKNFKDDLIEYTYLCCNKNYQQKFNKKLKNNFLIHTNFLTMIVKRCLSL